MATSDIISALNKDNVLAQRVQCGKCQVPMAQSEDGISSANIQPVKGKKVAGTDKMAQGLICGACLNNKTFKEQGPRNAVVRDEDTGEIRTIFYDMLLDYSEAKTEPAVAVTGDKTKEVTRSTATGKVTAREK